MRLVLRAYAGYNLAVGYCQGMGFIAGTLVMYMPAEDAFWCLVILLENPKYLQGYFDDGMVEIQTAMAMVPDLLMADKRRSATKRSNKPVFLLPSLSGNLTCLIGTPAPSLRYSNLSLRIYNRS